MSKPVCPSDSKANSPKADDIAIRAEDMEQAIYFGIVPDELIEAGRPYVTHDELDIHLLENEANFMSFGLTAWRAISIALENDVELPKWVRRYLSHVAAGIDHWALLNEHPAKLKDVLGLHGRRKYEQDDNSSDPRWVFDTISQMKQEDPSKSVTELCIEYLKQREKLSYSKEAIRKKYYQGKKLSETGTDYKDRGRKSEIGPAPKLSSVVSRDAPSDDF